MNSEVLYGLCYTESGRLRWLETDEGFVWNTNNKQLAYAELFNNRSLYILSVAVIGPDGIPQPVAITEHAYTEDGLHELIEITRCVCDGRYPPTKFDVAELLTLAENSDSDLEDEYFSNLAKAVNKLVASLGRYGEA